MKINYFLLMVFSIIVSSCDAPRDQRNYLPANAFSVQPTSSTVSSNNTAQTTNSTTLTPTTVANAPISNIPVDITPGCSFSSDGVNNFSSTSTHIGNFAVCKSSTNPLKIYFQVQNPPKDSMGNGIQLCFTPMTSSGDKYIYIGNPTCAIFNSSAEIVPVTFFKYPVYTNANMTGVMIFKDAPYYQSVFGTQVNNLTAFQACMNGLSVNNAIYCNSFQATGQYVVVRL